MIVASDYPDGPPRNDPRYHRVDLLEDPMDAVLRAGHPLARADGVRLETLSSEVVGGLGRRRPVLADPAGGLRGGRLQPGHRATDAPSGASSPSLVAAGCGVALIPRLAQPLPDDVVVCPVVGTPATRQIFAAVRAGAQSDPVVAAVLDDAGRGARRMPGATPASAPG